MKKTLIIFATAVALVVATAPAASAGSYDAFSGNIHVGSPQNGGINPDGRGRQTFGVVTSANTGLSGLAGINIMLGLDFEVMEMGITIDQLGIWDDNGDGLASDHLLALWRMDGTLLAMIPATGPGMLRDGFRYFWLPTPVVISPNEAFVAGVWYGAGNLDSNGNSGPAFIGGNPVPFKEPTPDFDSGNGVLSNIGMGRFGLTTGFPTGIDNGPANRYHAISFSYTPNPEPGTIVLLGSALAAGFVVYRRRKRNAG